MNNAAAEPTRCRLYLVTPPAISDLEAFAAALDDALSAGDVACVQLRLKGADDGTISAAVQALMPAAHKHDVAFLLNDRPDLALELGCDGVHIGPEDMPCKDARALMGPNATIGVTCKNSRHRAMELSEAGANYVAFGAVFPTTTKADTTPCEPEIISVWSETTNVPCVAIGGITVDNCHLLVEAGADFLAVSGGVWQHPDGPAAAVKAFNAIFDAVAA